eukprot:7334645-Pyramimonas_sp.AAC.1
MIDGFQTHVVHERPAQLWALCVSGKVGADSAPMPACLRSRRNKQQGNLCLFSFAEGRERVQPTASTSVE